MVKGATHKGCVDAAPFVRVMNDWIAKQDENLLVGPISRLANLMGMDPPNLRKILNGNRTQIGFSIADKIVTVCTGGFGWIEDPELEAIYQAFDFDWLDRQKPCWAVA